METFRRRFASNYRLLCFPSFSRGLGSFSVSVRCCYTLVVVSESEGHCQSFAALEEDTLDDLQVAPQIWVLGQALC
jgi:hypothetical protein